MKMQHLIPWTIKVDRKLKEAYRQLAFRLKTTPSKMGHQYLAKALESGEPLCCGTHRKSWPPPKKGTP